MPYILRKLPGKNLYRVRVKNTGKVLSYGTTLNKAKAQIRYMYMMDRQKANKSRRKR
jgi:hypothetical protein